MNFFPDERASELRELFFETAEELLQQLNEAGLQLEGHPGDAEIIRHIRRLVHTLKGDAAACGFREMSSLAHELEDALNPESLADAQQALVEVIFSAADTLHQMLTAYKRSSQLPSDAALREQIARIARASSQPVPSSREPDLTPSFDWSEEQRGRIEDSLQRGERVYNISLHIDPANAIRSAAFAMARNTLESLGTLLAIHPHDATAAEHSSRIEAALSTSHSRELLTAKCTIPAVICSVSVEQVFASDASTQDLLDVVLQAEARASGITAALPHKAPRRQSADFTASSETHKSSSARESHSHALRVDADRIDAALNLIGELIIGKSMLHRTILEFDKRHPQDPLRARFADALAIQSRVLEQLQRSVMKIRMVPVEQLFRRFPRVVRDIAKESGREVAVEFSGETTDLDKSILDALAEPMAHLVRNAVNHGIEPPHERETNGKAKRGTLRLNAYHQANHMVIEVSDDGRGIDTKKVVQRAIERGAITASEADALTPSEAMRLIFKPGLSTADEITETSGRGVGMDVVAGALERLKGAVEIESASGAGTNFRLRVPLTLASIQALLFRIGGKLYAAPLSNVIEITRIAEQDLHWVDNHLVLRLRDQLLTVARLHNSDSHAAPLKKVFVLVISTGERKFGLVVDALVGEEELVIKRLDDHMSASDVVSGASILGDGTVVLILNIAAVAGRIGRLPVLGAIA